jgi:hypothetical protein
LNPDPNSIESGSGSSFSIESGSGSRVLMEKNGKKTAEKMYMFLIKNWYLLIPCLLKGRPSYRRGLQPSKENIQHFKNEIY